MNVLKVIGGLVVVSIAACNIGLAMGRRESEKERAVKPTPNVGEAK